MWRPSPQDQIRNRVWTQHKKYNLNYGPSERFPKGTVITVTAKDLKEAVTNAKQDASTGVLWSVTLKVELEKQRYDFHFEWPDEQIDEDDEDDQDDRSKCTDITVYAYAR